MEFDRKLGDAWLLFMEIEEIAKEGKCQVHMVHAHTYPEIDNFPEVVRITGRLKRMLSTLQETMDKVSLSMEIISAEIQDRYAEEERVQAVRHMMTPFLLDKIGEPFIVRQIVEVV